MGQIGRGRSKDRDRDRASDRGRAGEGAGQRQGYVWGQGRGQGVAYTSGRVRLTTRWSCCRDQGSLRDGSDMMYAPVDMTPHHCIWTVRGKGGGWTLQLSPPL